MASEAEVDLVINASGALNEIDRDLQRIVRDAENNAPDVTIDALINQQGSLRDVERDLDNLVRRAEAGASDIDLDAVLNQRNTVQRLQRDLDAVVRRASASGTVDDISLNAVLATSRSITNVRGELDRVVRAAQAGAPDIDIDVDLDEDSVNRFNRLMLGLGRGSLSAGRALGSLGAGIGLVGAAAGSTLPLLAGLVTAAQQLAPAAALATSGMLALQLATGAVKIAMIGVEDAIQTAFDPEAKPEDLAKALEKLAPEAAEFVRELRGMKGAFDGIRLDVQERLFSNFAEKLVALEDTVLPKLGGSLATAATSLNKMATGAADAAVKLAKDGTLGRALAGATSGIDNLSKVPARAVTAFTQLAAAAGPSFDRVTKAIDKSFASFTKGLSKSFASGDLERAIDRAVDAFAQLGRIVANVFKGIGNILDATATSGAGLFGTLEQITKTFAEITASTQVQNALRTLSEVMQNLATTAAPLVAQALRIIADIIVALGPPVNALIAALGPAIQKVLAALAPLLLQIARTTGELVVALLPFVDVAARLVATLLPALTPLFEALSRQIAAGVPFIQAFANLLIGLLPLFAQLTEVMVEIGPHLSLVAERLFPVLTEALIELTPSIIELVQAFVQVTEAVLPLIPLLAQVTAEILDGLLPILTPLLVALIRLTAGGLSVLANSIRTVVVPAITFLVTTLRETLGGALRQAQFFVNNTTTIISRSFTLLKNTVSTILRALSVDLVNIMNSAMSRLGSAVLSGLLRVIGFFNSLPGRIIGALGSTGSMLFSAGANIVQGLLNGLTSRIGAVRAKVAEIGNLVASGVKGLLGISSPSKVMIEVGKFVMEGLMIGMRKEIPDLRAQIGQVTAVIPQSVRFNQDVRPSALTAPAPQVNVFIGNERLNNHIDRRVSTLDAASTRIFSQGVRR